MKILRDYPGEAPGIRMLKIDTTEFKMIDSDAERRDLRFDLYAMMLSARRITEDDIKEQNAIYRTLSFFLNTHHADGEDEISKDFINALVEGDIKKVIEYSLSFRPAGKWATPEYHIVSATLISA